MSLIGRLQFGFAGVAAGVFLIAPLSATAQDAPEGDATQEASSVLNEIVVTAQRTTSTLQKTPIAVSAFSDTLLQERQIIDVRTISTQVPGLVI